MITPDDTHDDSPNELLMITPDDTHDDSPNELLMIPMMISTMIHLMNS
jgi:hypothetical protein